MRNQQGENNNSSTLSDRQDTCFIKIQTSTPFLQQQSKQNQKKHLAPATAIYNYMCR
jgi:hypothetical protein